MINAIAITGLPRTGKSTIGKVLARRLQFSFLEASDIVKALFLEEANPGETYLQYVERRFSREPTVFANYILRSALEYQRLKGGVVISGFRKPEEIRKFREFFPYGFVAYLHCPLWIRELREMTVEAIIGEDVLRRNPIEVNWGTAEIEAFSDISIDTQMSVDDVVEEIVSTLSRVQGRHL